MKRLPGCLFKRGFRVEETYIKSSVYPRTIKESGSLLPRDKYGLAGGFTRTLFWGKLLK